MMNYKFETVDATTGAERSVEIVPDLHGFTIQVANCCVVVDFSGDKMVIYDTDEYENPIEGTALHVNLTPRGDDNEPEDEPCDTE
jgi:hypothetical protein